MAQPNDATHRNAGGDLFKPSKIRPGAWRQWGDDRWLRSSHVNETLTPIEMPAGDLNDSRPALPPTIGPWPKAHRSVRFETPDGVMHDDEESAVYHMLKRDVEALLNEHYDGDDFNEATFIAALLTHYELRQK